MTNTTTRARIGLFLSLGLLASTAAITSARAAEPKRLGVLTFRGPGEGVTRNVVTSTAKSNHFQVVGGQQIAKAATKLGMTLDTNDAFRAVAKDLGIAAFVTGEVTTKKATLTVRNGIDGSVSAEASWSGPNPKKLAALVDKTFWRRLGSAIERAKPPGGSKQVAVADEAPAPEPAAEPADADESEGGARSKPSRKRLAEASEDAAPAPPAESEGRGKRKKTSKKNSHDDDAAGEETTVAAKAEPEDEGEEEQAPEALDVAVGGRALTRSLTYVQEYAGVNSRYSLPVAPEVGFAADFYPAALFTRGFATNLGLTADASYMLPVVATPTPLPPTGNGQGSYSTYSLAWSVGAKVRLPYGLFAAVSYGDQRYQLTPSGGAMGVQVPMTDYKFVRAGAGIRYKATPALTVMVNAAYLHCFSLGQIGGPQYFPKGTAAGFDAGAAVGYRITPRFEGRVGVDIRRYGLAFHNTFADFQANPGSRVAGGAVDQYLSFWAALAVVIGGESGGGGAHHADSEDSDSEAAKASKETEHEDEADDAESAPVKKPSKKKAKAKHSDDDE